ncbi:member 7 [Tritrichomonas musculus]|uniref:Member 7 n=1 Tax=Tritrichomonas musculus TaxID=1915356 RepID=A0ABR2HFP7_9EUKA
MTTIRSILQSRAYEFLTKKLFTDCILKDETQNEHPAHAIILARRSTFFREYFQNNNPVNGNYVIEIKCNGQTINDLLAFVYSQTINVNYKNIVSLIKASQECGVNDLKEKAFQFLNPRIPLLNDNVVLRIIKDFINNGLDKVLISQNQIMRRLTTLLINADTAQKKNQIYDSISPLILARLLRPDSFDNNAKIDKASLIDEFMVRYKQNFPERDASSLLTNEEKQEFESDFESQNLTKLFIHCRCDWLTDATTRRCITQIINQRRNAINNFSQAINNVQENTSQWYPFIWASKIATQIQDGPVNTTVNIVKSLNTFDGFLDAQKPISPLKYGFVKVEASKELNKHFNPENAIWLDNSKYYLSNEPANGELHYTLCLGDKSRFQVEQLEIESDLSRIKGKRRQFPDAVKIEGFQCNGEPVQSSHQKESFNDEGKCIVNLGFQSPISKLKISMVGEERNGGNLLRIKFIDLKGHFI